MSIKKANALFKEGNLEQAILEYQRINNSNPLYSHAQFNIKLIKSKLNNGEEGSQILPTIVTNVDNNISGPLVSVVMPVFNVAPYLDASIMSVLNQTYQNIELIIVNDASTDNGMDIIRMYEKLDDRIKVIELEFNTLGGAGIPSNIGVDAASGKYVAYADSDDILYKRAIESLVSAAEKNSAEIVIGDFCNFDNESRFIEPAYDKDRWNGIPLNTSIDPVKFPAIFKLSPVPWRKLYNRSFLEVNKIRFPEGDYFYEDNPLHWFVLSSARKVVLTNEMVAFHRMARAGQTMGAGSYKLSGMLLHINSIRRNIRSNKSNVIQNEFIDFVVKTRWIINRQKNELLKNILSKRFYQELTKNDFYELESFKRNINKIKPLSSCYVDLDLTIVIYNDKKIATKDLLERLISQKDIKYNVYIINSYSEAIDEVVNYSYKDIDILAFNIDKGSQKVINSIIPICIGKYSLFLRSDFSNLDVIPSLIKKMKKDKLDLVYNRDLQKNPLNSFIVRTHHLRDSSVFFKSASNYDLSLFSELLFKTMNKVESKELCLNSSNYDSYSTQELITQVTDALKVINFERFNQDYKRIVLNIVADIFSFQQDSINFENFNESYKKEYSEIINYLEEVKG